MNSKELSEEVKDALKYTILCEYSIKISVMPFLENPIQGLTRNIPLHDKLSNNLHKQESIKVSNAKLTVHTLKSLQIQIFVIT